MSVQRFLALFSILLTVIFCVATIAAQDLNPEASGDTWELGIKLNSSDGLPGLVQFAVFDEDPVPDFTKRLIKNLTGAEEIRISNQKFGAWYRSTLLGTFWDFGFQAVTGDKVYLIGGDGTFHKSMALVIEADIPKTEKWIVTKSMQIYGEAIFWCIPVELKTGSRVDVTLSEKNTFDIKSVYNNAVAQAVEAAQ